MLIVDMMQGHEKDQRLLTEEVTSLRSQLERVKAEKQTVEEQLTETQMMLVQEQREHKTLAQNRAREMEEWSDEHERSLSMMEEMTKEVINSSSATIASLLTIVFSTRPSNIYICLQVEQLKSQKEELSRKNSSIMDSSGDGDDVMGDLPARIADMEAEIRVLRDQNKR